MMEISMSTLRMMSSVTGAMNMNSEERKKYKREYMKKCGDGNKLEGVVG